MNYLDSYNEAKEILISAGVKEAGLDARLLLEYVCKTDHSALFVHPERELTEDEEESFKEMLLRRKNREPLAYILGFWEFMGLEFKVNRDVLIPEQDSEFLVEEALRYCEDGFRILDLCTGSGCIALSILNYTNETVAVCTDISDKALEIARENAKELGLYERCEFIRTDLFPDNSCGRADIIVSNPPYIARSVIESLESDVKDYEPRIALDGDEDGLLFYRRIAERAGEFLFSSGYLFLEIGFDQEDAVTDILQREGCYHEIEVVKDFSGNTRVVKACYY